ncbi:TatD family hydrolase [Patescibacteria group bacterium]|nr:TatD family hydrolase [Patescibacteria group bacterium]
MLIDTHAHLQFDPLKGDLDSILERAKNEGVGKIIVVGIDKESSEQAIKLAEKYENIFAAIGLHPQDSKKINGEDWNAIEEMTKHAKVIAIGETGLDYFKIYSPKEIQIEVFKKHIHLANQTGLPLIVHNRDADEDSLSILQNERAKHVVFHCYSSSLEFARRVWAAGYMTSFTGVVTYKKSDVLREVLKECPLEKIMVETDCPYLAPQKYRGGTNEPSYIIETVVEIAKQKGMEAREIEKLTTENAERFFSI